MSDSTVLCWMNITMKVDKIDSCLYSNGEYMLHTCRTMNMLRKYAALN